MRYILSQEGVIHQIKSMTTTLVNCGCLPTATPTTVKFFSNIPRLYRSGFPSSPNNCRTAFLADKNPYALISPPLILQACLILSNGDCPLESNEVVDPLTSVSLTIFRLDSSKHLTLRAGGNYAILSSTALAYSQGFLPYLGVEIYMPCRQERQFYQPSRKSWMSREYIFGFVRSKLSSLKTAVAIPYHSVKFPGVIQPLNGQLAMLDDSSSLGSGISILIFETTVLSETIIFFRQYRVQFAVRILPRSWNFPSVNRRVWSSFSKKTLVMLLRMPREGSEEVKVRTSLAPPIVLVRWMGGGAGVEVEVGGCSSVRVGLGVIGVDMIGSGGGGRQPRKVPALRPAKELFGNWLRALVMSKTVMISCIRRLYFQLQIFTSGNGILIWAECSFNFGSGENGMQACLRDWASGQSRFIWEKGYNQGKSDSDGRRCIFYLKLWVNTRLFESETGRRFS